MKILLVSHYALPHLGGVEIVVDALARRFLARGHEVVHAAPASVRPGEERPVQTPYEIVRFPAWNGLESRGFPFPVPAMSSSRTLVRLVREADVVHAHGILFLSSTLALSIARKQRHPCRILTEHSGPLPASPEFRDRVEHVANATLGRFTARKAHAIVVVNPATAASMRKLAPAAEVSSIPNGVDSELFRPPEPGEREALRARFGWDARPRVLYVGRVMQRKGAHIAMEAARLASAGEFELVVAGSGEVGEWPANAKPLGPLPADEVAMLYRAADLFVLPSTREGFPVTLQEAMVSATPAVISDPVVYGQLTRFGTPLVAYAEARGDALLAAIRADLRDRAAAMERAAAAATFARTEFGWERTVDRHLELYDRIRSQHHT